MVVVCCCACVCGLEGLGFIGDGKGSYGCEKWTAGDGAARAGAADESEAKKGTGCLEGSVGITDGAEV